MERDFGKLTIKETHKLLIEKDISCVELTRYFLDVIQKNNKDINAFISVTEESAMEEARTIDGKISRGEDIGVLTGIPCAVKDNILLKGIKCTAGSKILENYIAAYDATVIKKLKEAGAVILGKTNLDEFAMGSSTENSAFGPTRNPIDPERTPGGSSGGSAAAVASGECLYSLGSETGGSIRQPAAFCGVVGLKPTYGVVSRHGLIAMASSLDGIGPIAKTVEDVKIVFNAIKGEDKYDATGAKVQSSKFKVQSSKFTVGVPKEYFMEGMDKGVEECVRKIIEKIGNDKNVEVREVSLPYTKYALPVYYILMPAEVSANLARYDGIKYGAFESDDSLSLTDYYFKTRRMYLGKEPRRRIMLGGYVLSEGHYDDYYKKAKKIQRLMREDFKKVFEDVDFLITPTTPTVAFKFGEKSGNPLQMYLSDIFTVSANIAGIPAISLPCGFSGNLPVGIQLMGRWFEEDGLFEMGKIIENCVDA